MTNTIWQLWKEKGTNNPLVISKGYFSEAQMQGFVLLDEDGWGGWLFDSKCIRQFNLGEMTWLTHH